MSKEVKRYSYGYVDDGNGNRYLGLIEKPDGNLVKHEDYEALLAERNAAQKDAERYRWLRDPCSGAERVIFYCRGDYGRGLMSSAMLDAVIDAALQGEQP